MTATEDIFVRQVSHQVGIIRYASGVRSRVLRLLNDTEADLKRQVRARLLAIEERGFDTGPQTTRRLNQLLAYVVQANNRRYRTVSSELLSALGEAASYEAAFNQRLIQGTASLAVALPSAETLASIVTSRPMQGRFVKDMVDELAPRSTARVHAAIRNGIAQGQTAMQITRTIFGTVQRVRDDGLMGVSRRGLAMLVNTSINHVMTHSRDMLYANNDDIIDRYILIATLDTRTTDECQDRDGDIHEVGSGELPPFHPNCRTATGPVLIGEDPNDIIGERASSLGSLNGVTFEDYLERLKSDPVALRMALKGKQRAKLFKDGGLSLDDLIGPDHKYYTIAQLRNREAAAFARAGL